MEDVYDPIDDDSFNERDEPREEARPMLFPDQPLFSALLLEVVRKQWPGDLVMEEFVLLVAPRISDQLAHLGAKGGDFTARLAEEGKDVARYHEDQSVRAHLINGLFPTLNVARTLQSWRAPQFRAYDDAARRVFIAGYVLHDFLKLPGVGQQLEGAGFSHDRAVGPAQMPVLEDIFRHWCSELGLDDFLESMGGAEVVLHDLIYVACNTQVRWGTLRNLRLLPRLTLSPTQLDLAEQLSRFSDYITYIARTPQEVIANKSIHSVLTQLSNGQARLTAHHLSDNRGVLTNFIHNAALAEMTGQYRIPLLYAPSGVVYLEHKEQAGPLPTVSQVAAASIQRIRQVAGRALSANRKGIKRDGKGMKYAEYYWLFFDLPGFIRLGVPAVFGIIHEGKQPSAGKRFTKMRDGGWMDPAVDLDLPDDIRVDQLAEWCFLAEKQVQQRLPSFDLGGFLLNALESSDLRESFAAVPRDSRAGGVPYHWYYAAGHYLKRHGGLDPAAWRERIEQIAEALAAAVAAQTGEDSGSTAPSILADWEDLSRYIAQMLTIGPEETDSRSAFLTELERYTGAKRRGHGGTKVCALCSSSYRVDKQQETAILFAPQVYSNKRPLNGSDAIRDICSICGIEMMLRQILMNNSSASGGDFEGRRVRYLYFYPTYFFTPETLDLLRRVYLALKRPSLTEVRGQLLNEEGQITISPSVVQRLTPFLLTPPEALDLTADRYPRLHFPEHEPVTFFFLGVPPPGRDAKDAEAWVHPALLALLLPLLLDVKVVASESSLPILLEASELPETVFFDAPHASIQRLLKGQTRINVDQVLPTLRRLLAAYLIHVDANSKSGAGGFDYLWQTLPALARDLDDSPLYVFHYLKKWQRKNPTDSLPQHKIKQYMQYLRYMDGETQMSHARELTLLYRRFYRAKRYNSNSILRPISVAAKVILEADPIAFNDCESLLEAVYGRLRSFSEAAQREGLAFFPKGSDRASREEAMQQFAAYFVNQVFYTAFHGDRSALRGKQLNLLKNACEAIYLEESARDRSEPDIAVADDAQTEEQ